MSDAISVKCPACKATLKLKSRGAVGKRVPCPKCKKPFVVQAPSAEEDDMAFLDQLAPAEEDVQEEVAPPPSPAPRKNGRKSKKPQGGSVNWLKPVLIGVAVLLFLGLLGGGGYLVATLVGFGGQNKIDMTYLAPDCDMVIHIRADDVLGSPLGKSVLAIPALKQSLDGVAKQYQIGLADVKSVTIGLTGVGDVDASAMVPGMPGAGAARFGAPGGPASKVRGTIVVRMSKSVPSDLVGKVPGISKAVRGGEEYYPPLPGMGGTTVYIPAPDVLIFADESEVQRIIDKGSRQTRRREFDFIDTTPQIVVAMINKPSAAAAQTTAAPPSAMGPGTMGPGAMRGGMGGTAGPGGMPMGMAGGGPPGMGGGLSPQIASLSGGKLKAWYLGLSLTQDLEIQTGLYCPESAAEARGDLEKHVSEAKSKFASQKSQLAMLSMFGLGDIVPHLEQTVNSLAVGGVGPTVQVTARIPGGIKGAIEKALPALAGLAKGGAGGFGAGFGGGLPPGFGAPPGDGDAPAEGDADQPAEEQPAEQGN